MDWLIFGGIAVAVIALGALAQRMGWIDLSDKGARRGGGTSPMVIGDEVFHPARYESQLELDRQTVLPAPAPLPGDGDLGVYAGRVEIDLTRERRSA